MRDIQPDFLDALLSSHETPADPIVTDRLFRAVKKRLPERALDADCPNIWGRQSASASRYTAISLISPITTVCRGVESPGRSASGPVPRAAFRRFRASEKPGWRTRPLR